VFSTWEWVSTWWKHFGKAKRLVILLIKEKNDILALAPFMRSKHTILRFGSFQKISFVGSHDSDYHHFILKKNDVALLKSLITYLRDCLTWDYLELDDLPERSVSTNLLRTISQEETCKQWDERVCNFCPYISLPSSMNLFMKKHIDRGLRKYLGRYWRKLEKRYCVSLKKYDELGTVNEAMDIFFQLHQKRWKSKDRSGAFNEAVYRDFHREIAKQFDEQGWLGLYFLTLNGQPVSALYGFDYNQKAYWYQAGFDPDYAAYSVGSLIMMLVIEKCIQKGLQEADLMRHAEMYKRRWTSKERKNLQVTYSQNGLFSRIYDFINKHNAFKNLLSANWALT